MAWSVYMWKSVWTITPNINSNFIERTHRKMHTYTSAYLSFGIVKTVANVYKFNSQMVRHLMNLLTAIANY